MAQAVTSTWRHSQVTLDDIRRVFYREPCILAKRNRDNPNKWKGKPTATKAYLTSDTTAPTTSLPPTDKDPSPDSSWPTYRISHLLRQRQSNQPRQYRRVHTTPRLLRNQIQYIFSYPVKSCNEDIFLHYLVKVLRLFSSRGFTTTTLRSDYYSTFRSARSEDFYEANSCVHQTSAPYQQWQNAAERDIQTILANTSATSTARTSYAPTPGPTLQSIGPGYTTPYPTPSPNSLPPKSSTRPFTSTRPINIATRLATSSASPLQDHERLWKFDVKNDIGFYLGDEDRIKGGNLVYLPYTHSILTRGNSHRILISDQQLLQWYSRGRDIRHSPLPYCIVKTAVLDLLSDRITPAGDDNSASILITPLTDSTDTVQPARRNPTPRNNNRTQTAQPNSYNSTSPLYSHRPSQRSVPPQRNNPHQTHPAQHILHERCHHRHSTDHDHG